MDDQVRVDPGKLCLSVAQAGRAWMTSPMEPIRTTRMRGLGLLLAVVNTLCEFPIAALVGGFFGEDCLRLDRLGEAPEQRGQGV